MDTQGKTVDRVRIRKIFVRLQLNSDRIKGLIGAAMDTAESNRDHLLEDILRSATVLSHATFEDSFRSLLLELIPLSGPDALDKIPLARALVDEKQARDEKFRLADLWAHGDRPASELIRDSVSSYLNRVSFSTIEHVTSSLRRVCIEEKHFVKYFPALRALMVRRHRIVHNADTDPHNGKLQPFTLSDAHNLLIQRVAIIGFIAEVVVRAPNGIDSKSQESAKKSLDAARTSALALLDTFPLSASDDDFPKAE